MPLLQRLQTAEKWSTTERTILTDRYREELSGVRVIDPCTGTDGVFDIVISQEFIDSMEPSSMAPSGLWMLPGLTDMHVHLRVPGGEGAETLATGLRAGVAGGVTTLGMMPNTSPPLDRVDSVVSLVQQAKELLPVTLQPIPCVTLGREGKKCVDFEAFTEMGIKAFSDDGSPVRNGEVLLEALERLAPFSGTVIEHPEMEDQAAGGAVNAGEASAVTGAGGIPESAEYEDVERCISILEKASSGAGLHLTHLSSPRSVELVRAASGKGLPVTCDVTPHHMTLTEKDLIERGAIAKMNPPLRSEFSRDSLVELLRGGFVDAIASDHAPHPSKAKEGSLQNAAFGITGLETMLPLSMDLLFNRRGMAPLALIRMLTSRPAEILGIPPVSIEPGKRNVSVLFAPGEEWVFDKSFSRSSNTPFLGGTLRGRVHRVWIGREIFREGSFV